MNQVDKRNDTAAQIRELQRKSKRAENLRMMLITFLMLGAATCGVYYYLEKTKPAQASAPPSDSATVISLPAEKETNPPATPPAPQLEKDSSLSAIPQPIPATVEPTPSTTPQAAEIATPPGADKAFAFSNESHLVLTGMDATRDPAIQRNQELLLRAIHNQDWDGYHGLLEKSIASNLAMIKKGNGVNLFDSLWQDPLLYQALLRWNVIHKFQPAVIKANIHDEYTGNFFIWLMNHSQAMEEFLLTIDPADDSSKVLQFLMEVRSLKEDQLEKYFSLALACAVVFDRPLQVDHSVGSKSVSNSPTAIDGMGRFLWYFEKNENNQLAAAMDRESAKDLIWAVSAPIADSEMEWAIKKMRLKRKSWGSAYGMIAYLMERAVEGLNPYEEYSFEQILEEGGICGDQTYFCVNTARANGIPAIGLSGLTDRGGHAWAAVKSDPNEWDTSVGRIGGVSKGQAQNPQTGESITEQEIQLWNDPTHKSASKTLSVMRHLWLADYFHKTKHQDQREISVDLAHQLGPSFPETWGAVYQLLEEKTQITGDPPKPSNLEDWGKFVSSMRREFKDNPRFTELAATAESKFIFPYGTTADAKRALHRERRNIERYSGEQTDLIASSLKRQADLVAQQGGPTANRDISQLYDKALKDYGGSIAGFKMMAQDYFGYVQGEPELARKATRDIELAYKRVVETGNKEYFRATTEADIQKMIADFYRKAGDEERAQLLEKRYERALERAKRDAL